MQTKEAANLPRPALSQSDWEKICLAISAYSHNPEYRELLGRLERLAKINGMAQSIARAS